MTELHAAAYDGDIEDVHRLLAAGMEPDCRDERGYTPLLWASFRAAVIDQVPVIEALVAAGADPNASVGDANCLILAAQSGDEPAVAALVAVGAEVDRDVDGVTALMVAAQAGETDIVKRLLAWGADAGILCGRFTAADYARSREHDQLAELLDAAASVTKESGTSR